MNEYLDKAVITFTVICQQMLKVLLCPTVYVVQANCLQFQFNKFPRLCHL
jgi:hypothetical protein